MNKLVDLLKNGFGHLLGISLVFCFFGIIYAAVGSNWSSPDTIESSSGGFLTSASWNKMLANFNDLNNRTISLTPPTGAISAFNLSACPAGWIAADGTSGTPDLRGQFLRGLNSFGSAAGTRADGKQDPVARVLGSYQADAFTSHKHPFTDGADWRITGGTGYGGLQATGLGSRRGNANKAGVVGNSAGGTETHPRNVSLIYCVKS